MSFKTFNALRHQHITVATVDVRSTPQPLPPGPSKRANAPGPTTSPAKGESKGKSKSKPNVTEKNGKFLGAFMYEGVRYAKSFDTKKEATDWVGKTRSDLKDKNGPHLGGPKAATLARALFDYARHFTVHKKSAKSELDRINRYLLADGQPALELFDNGKNSLALRTLPAKPAALPRTFKKHLDARLERRSQTNRWREKLARTRMSDLIRTCARHFRSARLTHRRY